MGFCFAISTQLCSLLSAYLLRHFLVLVFDNLQGNFAVCVLLVVRKRRALRYCRCRDSIFVRVRTEQTVDEQRAEASDDGIREERFPANLL